MNNTEFKKAGVDERTLPEEGSSKRSSSKRGVDSGGVWKSTASEEMEKFKKVPLIGHLPWRAQYVLFFSVLAVSLPALLFFAFGPGSKMTDIASSSAHSQAALSGLSSMYSAAGKGVVISDQDLNIQLEKADRNMPAQLKSSWASMKPLLNNLPEQSAEAKSVVESAALAKDRISTGLKSVAPKWRAAGSGGEWSSVEAVNLAQVISELQYLLDASEQISSGQTRIPERYTQARQNIEQSIRVYASSSQSTTSSNLSDAWRGAAATFTAAKPFLDGVIGRSKNWNILHGNKSVYMAQSETLSSSLSSATPPEGDQNKFYAAISGALAFISLMFIGLIGWKQQKWHAIEARVATENLAADIAGLGRQATSVANGDLTRSIKTENQILKPLSENFSMTISGLKSLIIDTNDTIERATTKAGNAIDATGSLIDISRSNADVLKASGQEVSKISESINVINEKTKSLVDASSEAMIAVESGQGSIEEARERIHTIREKSSEGLTRSKRMQKSSSEILYAARLLSDVSEQISVLSMQASLQAAKAGDAGAGFRVVAEGLKELAERSNSGARHVGSLIETNLSDVEALLEAMDSVTSETDEGSRLSDVSMESALILGERIRQLDEVISEITDVSEVLSKLSGSLQARTDNSMSQVEEASTVAQQASDAVLDFIEAVRGLEGSTSKFKVS